MGEVRLFSTKYKGLKVKTQLIREGPAEEHGSSLSNSEDVARFVESELKNADREHFLSILLNTKNVPIGVDEISIGSLNQSIIHPREVFKTAILASAAALVLVHNHPSGDPEPSREDIKITERLVEAGELLGIPLLDHVIIAGERHFSLCDKGLIKGLEKKEAPKCQNLG